MWVIKIYFNILESETHLPGVVSTQFVGGNCSHWRKQGLHVGNKVIWRTHTQLHILSLMHKQGETPPTSQSVQSLMVGFIHWGAGNRKRGDVLNPDLSVFLWIVWLCVSATHLFRFGLRIGHCGLCFFCSEGQDRLTEYTVYTIDKKFTFFLMQ